MVMGHNIGLESEFISLFPFKNANALAIEKNWKIIVKEKDVFLYFFKSLYDVSEST